MRNFETPSLKALRFFEAAGRFENFSMAGDALCVTQSAVSKQIAQLEQELGFRLFNRNRDGVRLTQAGTKYHGSVTNALEIIATATADMKLYQAGLNVIRLTTLPTLAMHWLIPKLPEFKVNFPHIAVDVSCSNELVDLTSEQMNAGIRLGQGEWPNLVSHHMFDEELITVCSEQIANLLSDSIEQNLNKVPLLHTTTRRDAWAKWSARHGIKLSVSDVVGFQDFFITIQAAVLGQGVAVVPSFLVQDELRDGRLVDPTNLGFKGDRGYYFVTSKETATRDSIVNLRNWLLSEHHDPISSRSASVHF